MTAEVGAPRPKSKPIKDLILDVEPAANALKEALADYAQARADFAAAEARLSSMHEVVRRAEHQLEVALARVEKLRNDVVYAVAPKGQG